METVPATPDPPYHALKVCVGDEWMTVEDASQTAPDVLREALTDAFAFVSLAPYTVPRIQLGNQFRISMQTERKLTPYRLQKVAEACQQGTAEGDSLEMKFFKSGGIHALTALAVAGTDDKKVGQLLSQLPDDELSTVFCLINSLKPHEDFQFMVEKVRRSRTRSSQRSGQPRPLPVSRKHTRLGKKERTRPIKRGYRLGAKPLAIEQLEEQTQQRREATPTESEYRVRSQLTNCDSRQARQISNASKSCEAIAGDPSVDDRILVENTTSLPPPRQLPACQSSPQALGSCPPLEIPTQNWHSDYYPIDLDTLDESNGLTSYYPIDLDNIDLFTLTS